MKIEYREYLKRIHYYSRYYIFDIIIKQIPNIIYIWIECELEKKIVGSKFDNTFNIYITMHRLAVNIAAFSKYVHFLYKHCV